VGGYSPKPVAAAAFFPPNSIFPKGVGGYSPKLVAADPKNHEKIPLFIQK
jgi:hypothetical protein